MESDVSLRIRRWAGRASQGIALIAGLAACGAADPDVRDSESTFVVLSEPVDRAKGPPLPSEEIWTSPLDDRLLESGRQVWVGTCIQCHATGLGGAPLIGSRGLWAPRIEQGLEVLVEHALNGFHGDEGEMPARGGNLELTDEQVRAAVHFMASRAM